jgi:Ca-activated chloride channel homolog
MKTISNIAVFGIILLGFYACGDHQPVTNNQGKQPSQQPPASTTSQLQDHQVKEQMELRGMAKSMAGSGTYNITGVMSYGDDYYPVSSFNTESYDLIRENNFKEVLQDPVSTFSVDVDRASYANVRRFLDQQMMPPVDAVRIEELINYFDYDYPLPQANHPFSVTTELGACPWNVEHDLLLVGLKGQELASNQIPPANLVFLIDVSGSMNAPNKLPLLKQAFKILIPQLRPEDRISMVVYAGAAGCVLEPTSGKEKERITNALNRLEAGGSTAGEAGIKLAYQLAKQHFMPHGNNRVILATDGDFNVGPSSDAAMTRLIEEKRKEGIFLTVLGFGMGNYKDSKMEQLSNAGNGNYAYIDHILEAKKIFGTELWGTLYTIAKDVKIQIEFNPQKVRGYRLIGYENRLLNREDFNDDKKDAGEIGSGHTVTALYEIIPAGSKDPVPDVDPLDYQKVDIRAKNSMMTLKLRYKNPADTISQRLIYRLTKEEMTKTRSTNLDFAAAVAEFGMMLRNSEFKGQASYHEAKNLASGAMGKDPHGYKRDFVAMIETAELLSR